MKKLIFLISITFFVFSLAHSQFTISKTSLKDKIKGGWAGQTIGVTFGGPYEFQFNGTFIQDYQPLEWNDNKIYDAMINNAGLYDDVYMDLTFVDVFEKYGMDAPLDSFANAYANAGYMLWHANQAGRYNVLNGIKAPASGHWKNNPHADDIDFQIEADFAGLMSPAMPRNASRISDKIGHIMNYGDGWYGGVYMANMYALAFTSNSVDYVVTEALKSIPAQTDFYKCIADVIKWSKQYPNDWHQTWYEIQKKWSMEVGCPDGVFAAFNIDAKINAAYVVLGLLYGKGNFDLTMEIATRAGQDADCNPSSACGVLGTMIGYEKIPAKWKKALSKAEDINFKYTELSLNKTYELGYKHALKQIELNGGTFHDDYVIIKKEAVQPVKFEQSFPGLQPLRKLNLYKTEGNKRIIEFDGVGIIVRGEAFAKKGEQKNLQTRVSIDGGKAQTINLPSNFTTRRHDLYWNYELGAGRHVLELEILNAGEGEGVRVWDYIVYGKR